MSTTKTRPRRQSTIQVDPEDHRMFRIAAALRGISIKEAFSQAVSEYVARHTPTLKHLKRKEVA